MDQLVNHLLALHYVQPMSVRRLQPLLQEDATLDILSYIAPSKLAQTLKMNSKQARQILEKYRQLLSFDMVMFYEQQNIVVVPFFSELYPSALLEVYDPPAVIYCKGKMEILQKNKKLAIVGSRTATNYSQKSIDVIVPELIAHDVVIVSGLAKGVDSMAHFSAIKEAGRTIGVLGNGFNHTYPKENANLQHEMEQNQLVITEYPPYMSPRKWNFPMRNRIISGISAAILVTEAAEKSGTMSTVDYGLNHGRNIFTIPGDIFSPLSKGPNALILEGATPIWNGQQIIEETKIFSGAK
ncbi:MAG: DNA-processing protein DprA [Kurthia sp.]|nr:DNA-processing protein DprA [Candidatus Kurthia equi]